jgi:hypothetical protein
VRFERTCIHAAQLFLLLRHRVRRRGPTPAPRAPGPRAPARAARGARLASPAPTALMMVRLITLVMSALSPPPAHP